MRCFWPVQQASRDASCGSEPYTSVWLVNVRLKRPTMQAVFLTKGGRDAVQPVVAVAASLQTRHPETVVSLITPRDHKASSASSRRCTVRFCICQVRMSAPTHVTIMTWGERDAKRVNSSNCVATVTNDIRHHGSAERCNDNNIRSETDLNQPGIHTARAALGRLVAQAQT